MSITSLNVSNNIPVRSNSKLSFGNSLAADLSEKYLHVKPETAQDIDYYGKMGSVGGTGALLTTLLTKAEEISADKKAVKKPFRNFLIGAVSTPLLFLGINKGLEFISDKLAKKDK